MAAHKLLAYDGALAQRAAEDSPTRVVSLAQIADFAAQIMAQPQVLLENQREAFLMLARGDVAVCPIQTLGQPPLHQLQAGPDAQVCVKTGYVKDDQVFCLKIAGGGSDYAGNTGMMQVFCQRTLRLQCVLQDEGILTEMRTAAAACVASSLMMPREVAAVGIVGASVQAIWQLRFLRGILPASTRKVVVRSRTQASAAAFRDKMLASPCDLDRGWDIVTYEEAKGAGAERPFADCRLIHTASCAREPAIALTDLLAPDGRRGPVHISAMGADSAGKQELGLDLVENADLLVCDSLLQARERGEFQHYFAAHAGSPPKQVIELGKLLSSPEPVRSKQTQDSLLTIFDSSGVAVQDVCIAKLVSHMLNQAS